MKRLRPLKLLGIFCNAHVSYIFRFIKKGEMKGEMTKLKILLFNPTIQDLFKFYHKKLWDSNNCICNRKKKKIQWCYPSTVETWLVWRFKRLRLLYKRKSLHILNSFNFFATKTYYNVIRIQRTKQTLPKMLISNSVRLLSVTFQFHLQCEILFFGFPDGKKKVICKYYHLWFWACLNHLNELFQLNFLFLLSFCSIFL